MEKVKVLAIDDEQIVLDSVRKILEEEGFDVHTAKESKAGLERALKEDFSLIMTDIKMPVIGGMRILRDVKRKKPHLPVVIFTGYATVQSAVQAMKLGASDYLEKPFTPNMLATAARKAIEKAGETEPDPQEIVHREEVLRVLARAAADSSFVANLLYEGADALDEYDLSGPEKLAILTGDVHWIESQIGELTADQKKWLEQRLNAEIW